MMVLLTSEEYREIQAMQVIAQDKFEWVERYKKSEDDEALELGQSLINHLDKGD